MPDSLARSIRDKIARGELPAVAPRKLWAGHGTGRPCDACGRPIAPTDLEHELDFANRPTLRFHADCSETWRRAITGGVPDRGDAGDDAAATG